MEVSPAIRLDKWLWHARLCKTRGLAARLVVEGRVRVNAVHVLKPAAPLRIGDGVTFARGGAVRVLRVRAFGLRRGPAAEARLLYDDLTEPPPPPGLEPPGSADT
jgi:ribosome-associated heat shock protein Hsp15